MQIISKEIRENARISLKGKWGVAILCTLLYGNLSIITDFIPKKVPFGDYSIILTFVSTAVFVFGYNNTILQMTRSKDVKFIKFFSGCKWALRGFRMIITVGVCTLLWTILLVVPGVIAMIKYSMTFFIWVYNPDLYISEVMEKSVEITYGHKLDIFKLVLSFIGWFLLLIGLFLGIEFIARYYFDNRTWISRNCGHIILSVGILYLATYINVSMAVLYNKLISINSNEENQLVLNEQTRQLD